MAPPRTIDCCFDPTKSHLGYARSLLFCALCSGCPHNHNIAPPVQVSGGGAAASHFYSTATSEIHLPDGLSLSLSVTSSVTTDIAITTITSIITIITIITTITTITTATTTSRSHLEPQQQIIPRVSFFVVAPALHLACVTLTPSTAPRPTEATQAVHGTFDEHDVAHLADLQLQLLILLPPEAVCFSHPWSLGFNRVFWSFGPRSKLAGYCRYRRRIAVVCAAAAAAAERARCALSYCVFFASFGRPPPATLPKTFKPGSERRIPGTFATWC
ncbi:hypothetical protein LZ31DRAFT_592194 [Colletotrichum somersetense]|nr:hypothetical protein LZ31DRAFT_592194 [Colletotrichum somersetense]